MKKIVLFTIDILIAALLVLGIWGVNYLVPQKGIQAQAFLSSSGNSKSSGAQSKSLAEQKIQSLIEAESNGLQITKVKLDHQDWHEKFSEKFTKTVVSTDTSYTSPNLSIQLTSNVVQTNQLDYSEDGQHKKYGTNISYILADIYVGDITCIQTAFAQNTYGVGYEEKLTDMSAYMKSVLAVNGDSYSNSRHAGNGTIIRNGIIYRSSPGDMETCVLNWDGTMKIYAPQELNKQQLINEGAYQSWVFGPSLLDENGKAKTSFLTWDYIRQSHPRTAIGYYEPGHYCLLVVDGRQKNTRGMFLSEMASMFEQLGCKAAYNLDGGHCSFMTKGNQIVNHPYKPEHKIQDGIFLTEGL
ncbi:Exopolysaccharide biosynthesis protein related to N-acetylglucosamine-1-phosphodiester alpha-N-acetylglucosaminidase [uncultured Roseburia sp.]|uniref:Phosphodiester glycosidase family protein n=1 Tax=Brotonthovivens ammoniilytica TaxID=2981725 RepID=A0ABT2TI46_9FIRM|nr:phosphodiester glycosidase family protein [Brotonthovivens ammoniilytica]MCU6761327.1 phosphodiester glycosidase family protein [Brotonthovivens ammoniilytica]SCI25362.1 Exopolysaccharide biosynthesis protein related to N-acetylglucosamine-1-phosphodiester alpha-N-acetylglucosaminidase [uncultured Roseburia sp.]